MFEGLGRSELLVSLGREREKCEELQETVAKQDAELEDLRSKLAAALTWEDAEDKNTPEDAEISAAFPTRSNDHETYGEAMRLVGARYSKGALVALVNWLLRRVKVADTAATEAVVRASESNRAAMRAELERSRVDDGPITHVEEALDIALRRLAAAEKRASELEASCAVMRREWVEGLRLFTDQHA